jgi:hypothetical protein
MPEGYLVGRMPTEEITRKERKSKDVKEKFGTKGSKTRKEKPNRNRLTREIKQGHNK